MARQWNKKRVGIIGGGQLARMLQEAAHPWAVDLHFLDPQADAPVSGLSKQFVQGDWQSADAVEAFGSTMDVVGLEFEAISLEGLERLEAKGIACYPGSKVLRIIQDKGKQKQFLEESGLPTAPFHLLKEGSQVPDGPCVVKLRKGGYDGYGVKVYKEAPKAEQWPPFSGELLIEELADIDREISVMVARFPNGSLRYWDPTEMVFHEEANMLAFQLCPARISGEQAQKAQELAAEAAEKLGLIGLLAVEFFLLKDGELWINEMAPRPHNSGHQTIEASYTSQFEQYLRILLGLAPGATESTGASALVNLLGGPNAQGKPDYSALEALFKEEACYLHLYGKTEVKPYRKMGHICLLSHDIKGLEQKAREISTKVKVTAGK